MKSVPKGRKLILAIGVGFFFVGLILKIDTALIQTLLGLPDEYERILQLVASACGAIGGILVAVFYLLGFIAQQRKKVIEDEV
jgi:hypothetical protein